VLEYVGTCFGSIFVFFTPFEFVCVRDSDLIISIIVEPFFCISESLVSLHVIVIILMIIEYDFLFMLLISFSAN
jgi:hypothetical protein